MNRLDKLLARLRRRARVPAADRFFYHNFPRRREGDAGQVAEKGLAIIRSMCERGIVLTPERVQWREVIGGPQLGAATCLYQQRTSFTELASSELPRHAHLFGPFAIEFELAKLRSLGALPVMYIPAPSEPIDGMDGVGATAIARLVEATDVMNSLVFLAFAGEEEGSEPLRFKPVGWRDPVPLDGMTRAAARRLVAALFDGKQDPGAIAGALNGIGDLFYPTERADRGDPALTYYRQREWRLTSNLLRAGRVVDRPVGAADRSALLAIDEEFFGKEIEWLGGRIPRVTLCRFLEGLDGRAFLTYAQRVVAPRSSCEKVRATLSRAGFRELEVVPLESFGAS